MPTHESIILRATAGATTHGRAKPQALRRRHVWPLTALLLATSAVGCKSAAPEAVDAAPPGATLTKCGIVLEVGAPDSWEGAMVESAVIWYDEAQGRYGMAYTGYDIRNPDTVGYAAVGNSAIGIAWSDDLRTWTKDPRNPILTGSGVPGSPDESGVAGALMWVEDGTYYLFYVGMPEPGYEKGLKTIDVATSTDLTTWERYAGNPLIVPEGEGWRYDAIWRPHIVKVDGTYYLFFNASGTVDDHYEEYIGYATSTDLLNWTVHDEHNPVLVGSRTPGAWDASGRAGDPSLYRVGDTWYMAFYSWNHEAGTIDIPDAIAQDGLAYTSAADFPLGWKLYEGNPVVRVGGPGSFDEKFAHKPFVIRTDRGHHHFYTAVDAREKREIALAVEGGTCE